MATVEQDLGVEHIIGRQGIKIPKVEFKNQVHPGDQVLDFFHNLWDLNGHNSTTHRRSGEEIPYTHELALAEIKPFVIIRGGHTVVGPDAINWQRRRNLGLDDYSKEPIVKSIEKHELLVPPDALGKLVTALSVKLNHDTGKTIIGMGRFPDPYTVNIEGETIRLRDFIALNDGTFDERFTKAEENYSRAVFSGLQKATDLLKVKTHAD